MTRKLLRLAAAVAALASLPAAASAAVTYVFTADSSYDLGGRSFTGGFTFTTNDYITANKSVPAASLTSCTVVASDGIGATCGAQQFFVGGGSPYDSLSFAFSTADGGIAALGYHFDAGAFAGNGSYETVLYGREQHGTLTISGFAESPTGGVPEPTTWALMIAGFGLAGASLRRRGAVAAL